jgi:hypothetical protein
VPFTVASSNIDLFFNSDGSVVKSGFRATYRVIARSLLPSPTPSVSGSPSASPSPQYLPGGNGRDGAPCNVAFTESSGTITLSNYANNAACGWG